MGYDIVRLFALDWPATVAALHAHGDDFYWLARTPNGEDIDYAQIPFVAEYDGALAGTPGWRDPTAAEIYDGLREYLDGDSRARCDACFSRLFWKPSSPSAVDASPATDVTGPNVWSALSPSSVRDVLDLLGRIPWTALHEAAARYPRWGDRYLPTVDDFESQVRCHEDFLVEAAKRNAGTLSLVSQ